MRNKGNRRKDSKRRKLHWSRARRKITTKFWAYREMQAKKILKRHIGIWHSNGTLIRIPIILKKQRKCSRWVTFSLYKSFVYVWVHFMPQQTYWLTSNFSSRTYFFRNRILGKQTKYYLMMNWERNMTVGNQYLKTRVVVVAMDIMASRKKCFVTFPMADLEVAVVAVGVNIVSTLVNFQYKI